MLDLSLKCNERAVSHYLKPMYISFEFHNVMHIMHLIESRMI